MSVYEKPYILIPEVERDVLFLICTSPSFYARIGKDILANRMPDDRGKVLVRAVHDIAQNVSRSPSQMSFVVQRIRVRQADWKITHEEFAALSAFAEEIEGDGFLRATNEEDVIIAITPIIEKQKFTDAEETFFKLNAEGGTVQEVIDKLREVQTVGESALLSHTNVMGDFEPTKPNCRGSRLCPTGIPSLDELIQIGIPCGTLNFGVTATGAGKSMFLQQIASYYCLNGLHGLYVTLENPTHVMKTRLLAAITDVPEMELRLPGPECDVAWGMVKDRTSQLVHRCGTFEIYELARNRSTFEDIKQLVAAFEHKHAVTVDFLMIDYIDKLIHEKEKDGKYSMPIWQRLEAISDAVADYAKQKAIWAWSVSQTTEKDRRSKLKNIDTSDLAGGKSKARTADFVAAINTSEDNRTVSLQVLKNRYNEARGRTPDEATQFVYGRLTRPAASWSFIINGDPVDLLPPPSRDKPLSLYVVK